MSVKSKIVVITGAGSGIGAATAKLFAEEGAKVIVSDINIDKADLVVKGIKDMGGVATAIRTDVTDTQDIKDLIKEAVQHYGQLDIMINNAGIGPEVMAKTAEHTLDDWDKVVAVNQTGVFYCMKWALQHMDKQGSGNIVNVASLAGLKASGKNLAYSASKFAVVGMTKSAALEYASKNIRINCVCPGYTHSPLLDKMFQTDEGMREKLVRFIPMRRYGQATEIAEAILWLASDKTSFVTGQALTLDGGLSL